MRKAALVLCCLGVPPPTLAQGVPPPVAPATLLAAPQAPWDPSPAPYFLEGDLIPVEADHNITRPLILVDHSGFDVDAGRTLRIDGDISTDDAIFGPTELWKLGDDRDTGGLQLGLSRQVAPSWPGCACIARPCRKVAGWRRWT